MSRAVDVAIVGAGPAGAATALCLLDACPSMAGRVVVFDRARFPREKTCAGAVGGRGVKLLDDLGVRLDAIAHLPMRAMSVRYASGARTHRRDDLGVVVRRDAFDHLLVRTARLRGAEVRDGEGVRALRHTPGGVAVETDGGRYEARALVGADGVGSFVRRWMGLPTGGLLAHAVEVDTERLPGDLDDDVLHFDGGDASVPGYAWDFPTPVRGRVLRSRGVYALTLPGRAPVRASWVEAKLRARLAARGLDLDALSPRRMVERGHERHVATSRGRALLAGEAAGVDPVAGEGIAQALAYGALAGRYLAARRGDDGDFDDWPAVVSRSSLGVDLALREGIVRVAHSAARPWLERAMLATPLGLAGACAAFAGPKVTTRHTRAS